jgi:hypothetical protein
LKLCDKVFESEDDMDVQKEDAEYWKKLLYDEIMTWNKNENHMEGDAIVTTGQIIVGNGTK